MDNRTLCTSFLFFVKNPFYTSRIRFENCFAYKKYTKKCIFELSKSKRMKRYFLVFSFLIISTVYLLGQAGQSAYTFLELPISSHMAALGGSNVCLRNNDINFALSNPSLLSPETDNQLALNFTKHIVGVSVGSAVYGNTWNGNMFGIGMQYVDYGTFDETSETNQNLGTFTAKDYALSFIYAKQLGKNWQGGITLKPIYSAYESYTSFAMGVDVGLSYDLKDKGVSLGAALQNVGTQITSYNNQLEKLPFNSLISFSEKFIHAPLRVSLTAHHLQVWNLNYLNTITTTSLTGVKTSDTISFVDMFFRHLIVAIDFIPSKNIYFTVGYNHERAAELGLSDLKTSAGFSFGGGLTISKFQIGFAASQFQKGIMAYQFSISTDLNSYKK